MRSWRCGTALLLLLAACAPPDEAGLAPPVDAGAADLGAAAEDAVAGFAPEIIAPPAPVVAPEPASTGFGGAGRVRAGVLTAGDIDDNLNPGAFARYLAGARGATGLPQADFGAPVLARLTGPDGAPAAHVRVTLRRPGASEPFWDGYSGPDGRLAVFPAALGAGRLGQVELRAFPEDQGEPVIRTLAAGRSEQIQLPFGAGAPGFLDLVLVVDATGSMGDEMAWLQRDLDSILGAARRGLPGLDVRVGLVLYRDQGDAFVVRATDLSGNVRGVRSLLAEAGASGGGDYPEAAADGMAAALGLSWRRGQGERLLIHVADAPPHDGDARRYLDVAGTAAEQGIQVFGLGASGVAAESEYLMRQAAALTQGRYLFLTDDSGVGLEHAEPTISCYLVTELRGLMIRVLRSELTGRRIEPAPGEVIRQVGSYQNGVCRD